MWFPQVSLVSQAKAPAATQAVTPDDYPGNWSQVNKRIVIGQPPGCPRTQVEVEVE